MKGVKRLDDKKVSTFPEIATATEIPIRRRCKDLASKRYNQKQITINLFWMRLGEARITFATMKLK
jgi:hypothetical protein